MTTVVASPGQGPDRQVEVQYSDAKVILYFLILDELFGSKVSSHQCYKTYSSLSFFFSPYYNFFDILYPRVMSNLIY